VRTAFGRCRAGGYTDGVNHADRARREAPADRETFGGAAGTEAARVASGPPPLRLARSDVLAGEVRELREALAELRARSARLGSVETLQAGWRGRIELAVKALVRKLILRHIDQQREIDEATIRVLERLASLVEQQNALADANAVELSDFAVRAERRRT